MLMLMVPTTKVTGMMTNSMEWERSSGLMVQNMKVSTLKVRNMGEEYFLFPITLTTMVSSKTMKSVDLGTTTGLMANITKGLGTRTKCMEMESSHGLITKNIKDSFLMTKEMEVAILHGLMVGSMMENGRQASNMEEECMLQRKASGKRESGRMVKRLNG